MAEKSVQVQMSKDKEYKSCTRYTLKDKGASEAWEMIYVWKGTIEKIGKPDVIKVTIEAVS